MSPDTKAIVDELRGLREDLKAAVDRLMAAHEIETTRPSAHNDEEKGE